MEKFGQSLALSKNLLIAVRRLSGDGLALSVTLRSPRPGCGSQRLLRCRLHPAGRGPNSSSLFPPLAAVVAVAPKGGGFLRLFAQKLPKSTFYWTFILLYSCQNKKTQEGRGMKDVELRYVGGHVEVYTGAGAFLFSADTLREAMEELDAA